MVLCHRARNERRTISLDTLDTFGLAQADPNHAQLQSAFTLLRQFPELGRPKDNLRPGLRLYAAGRHQILYTVTDAIEIEGLPHDSRDLDAYVAPGKGG